MMVQLDIQFNEIKVHIVVRKILKKKKKSPVLKEAQCLAYKGHLHFNRSATFEGVFSWPQQHICHLFYHQPHV